MGAVKLFKYSRTSTLILLSQIDEDKWDTQPDSFPNTVRWNAGHVYVTAEEYLADADETYSIVHPEWLDLFLDGTRPSEWTGYVPTKDEIIEALKTQETRLENHFKDKLNDSASIARDINGTLLETVNESLQFVTWHEGIHLGFTNALRRHL